MRTRILSAIFLIITGLSFFYSPVKGSETKSVNVIVFVRKGCSHCQNEEKFLEKLAVRRNDITVTYLRLENDNDKKLWQEFTDRNKISKVTPITIIGDKFIIGFDNDKNIGLLITQLIDLSLKNNIATDLDKAVLYDQLSSQQYCDESGNQPCPISPSTQLTIPFIGKIDYQKYPLFILASFLGFIDGFNPCALWVLITFLIILSQIGNRKKMIQFAGTFIIAEGLMYALIITVWYKTWDFVRLDSIITPIIGIVTIIGGIFFIKEWHKKELECKVTDFKSRQKIRQKIHNLANDKFTLATFIAVLLLAFSVNIIEFACSVGIPQTFTKILELNKLPLMQNITLIAVYIFFYMIDDFIVFAIALYSIDKIGITTKYSKIANLVGGIIMIMLGLLLIFSRQSLIF